MISKNKALIIGSVEYKNEAMFRVIPDYAFKDLKQEITIAFEVIREQEPRINGDCHVGGKDKRAPVTSYE